MYSGHNLFYAFKLTLNDIKDIFNVDNDIDERYEIKEFLNEIFENINSLEFLFLPCCYYRENIVFLGFNLGHLSVQYRDNIDKYDSFEDYYSTYLKMIGDIKKEYNESINRFEDDIQTIFAHFPKIKEYVSRDDLKFYTVPDDCESCT